MTQFHGKDIAEASEAVHETKSRSNHCLSRLYGSFAGEFDLTAKVEFTAFRPWSTSPWNNWDIYRKYIQDLGDITMIIDTHLHYGKKGLFSLDFSLLLQQMEKYGIGKGLVSTIECCEYKPDVDELFHEQTPQIEANQALIREIQRSGKKLYVSFWCRPAAEKNADQVYSFIKANRQIVKGLKFHPYYSRLPLEDKRYDIYIDIARQLDLPVSVHTSNDNLSNPGQLLAMAKRFPQVPFIMVHMGLYTDHEVAIQALREADNLYGDTTWVPFEKVEKAIHVCGCEKLLFGSDAPIDGEKSYHFYEPFFAAYHKNPAKWQNLMSKNAETLFKI